MSKGPGLFSNIGRQARDILTKDYNSDQKFSISTDSDTGVALVSTTVNKGGLSSGDVGAQYKYKNTLVNAKVDTQSNISTTLTVTDVLPSTKTIASFKFPDYNSGKLEVQYFHEHAAFSTAVGLNKSSTVDCSATLGTPTIAFGAEASYLPGSGNFTKYNAGLSFSTKPNSISSVILADKGDSIRASYLHNLGQGTVVGEMSRKFSTNENILLVGGSYAVDRHTLVKAKLDNNGNLGALLQHELKPKSFLTISGAFDAKALEKTPRFGVALSLKP